MYVVCRSGYKTFVGLVVGIFAIDGKGKYMKNMPFPLAIKLYNSYSSA